MKKSHIFILKIYTVFQDEGEDDEEDEDDEAYTPSDIDSEEGESSEDYSEESDWSGEAEDSSGESGSHRCLGWGWVSCHTVCLGAGELWVPDETVHRGCTLYNCINIKLITKFFMSNPFYTML